MKTLKRFLWIVAAGSLLGAVAFAWFSPGLIEWYFSPPADLALTCKPAVEWGIETYRKVMFAGVLIGGIGSGILFFAIGGSRGKSAVAATAPGVEENK